MSGRIPYKQMYAQAIAELNTSGCTYWFTSEDEQAIQRELSKRLNSSDVPNLRALGITLKKLRWERGGIDGMLGYYLKLKS